MKAEQVKQDVREHYAAVVREGSSCCGPGGCGSGDASDMTAPLVPDYGDRDQDVVAAADLGLGCGDPVRFSGLKEGMTVLDLGSGGGIDVFLSAKEVGSTGRAIGLDMTDEMLERAEENRRKLGLWNTMFVKGEIENIPLPGGSVDRIISNCVINLVPDKGKAFREMYRVLNDGGSFVISDIVTDREVPALYRQDPFLWSGCVAGAVEKEEYLAGIREAGFGDVEVLAERKTSADGNLPFAIYSITVRATKEPERS